MGEIFVCIKGVIYRWVGRLGGGRRVYIILYYVNYKIGFEYMGYVF